MANQRDIERLFETTEKNETVISKASIPLKECRVVFLGDIGTGKSLIVKRLILDGEVAKETKNLATEQKDKPICINSKEYQKHHIKLHFWDFGETAIIHSLYKMFLTQHSLYVVVASARTGNIYEQALRWIREIQSCMNNAPVFLLINQKDKNMAEDIQRIEHNKFFRECHALKSIRIVSALNDDKESFIAAIQEVICHIVSNMEGNISNLGNPKSALFNLNKMPNKSVAYSDFFLSCIEKGIEAKKEVIDSIIYQYQNIGSCYYNRSHPLLSEYVILNPGWILNAFYILLNKGKKYASYGLIHEEDIYTLLLNEKYNDFDNYIEEADYKPHEVYYMLCLFSEYKFIHKFVNESLFIPMLCNENEPETLALCESEDALHIYYEYKIIPEIVFYRFMERNGYSLNTNYLWKTGAIFESKKCGWSSLIRIKQKRLDVYAYSKNQESHPVNVYLDIIRESINSINNDLGLESNEYIAYRKDGKEDYFNYQDLLRSKQKGIEKVYSRIHQSAIFVDEILGLYKNTKELLLIKKIYKDILLVCNQIQSRSIYRSIPGKDVKEDDRNDAICDLLSNRGYYIRDQSHTGHSDESNNPGEVDLMILESENNPIKITLIEALNLSGARSKYILKHLDKLVDAYNDCGLRHLFLVSYVELSKTKFPAFWERYKKKVRVLGGKRFMVDNTFTPELIEGNNGWIKSMKLAYSFSNEKFYVYHICVMMSN